MIPSRTPLKLYWQMVDHFAAKPGGWRFYATTWQVDSIVPAPDRPALSAVLQGAIHDTSSEFVMAAQVGVADADSPFVARRLERQLEKHGVHARLQRHGYKSVSKAVSARTFGKERRFLSELCGRSAGALGNVAPRSMSALAETFRGRKAGDWHPLTASWELRRPLRISGRPATALCMFHLAPADLEGTLGLASSITIWPTVLGSGPLPRWVASQRRRLDSQYRAAGHKAEWYRGPRGQGVMITSMREDLRGLRDVLRERRVLEEVHLGDPG